MNHQSSQPVTNSPDRKPYAIFGVIGVILLVTIGYLAYSNVYKNNQLEMVYADVNEAHSLQAELDNQYRAAIAELESLKGSHGEMDALINKQQTELEDQKSRIETLLVDRSKLKLARQEINGIKTQMQGYLVEIDKLKADNQLLTTERDELVVTKQALQNDLMTKEMENTQLNESKATLVSQNEELANKVKIGSAIAVKDLKVEGLKLRSNGKTRDRSTAKKVDVLNVCFKTTPNEVVAPGPESFYVRIVNPRGETLAVEDLGSGTMTNEKTGEQVRFTQTAETKYNNDEQQLCLSWKPNTNFEAGKYAVEVFNKGFLVGASSFELK